MVDQTRQSGLPRMTYAEPIFFDDTMLGHIGVINGQKQWGKRYAAAENFMSHLDEVIEAIDQGFIFNRNTKEVCKIPLDPEAVRQVKQIWYNNTFIGIFRHPRFNEKILSRKFYYTKQEIRADIDNGFVPSEIEPNPALKRMKPRRPPTTNPLWVEIRESMPMKYCWEGYDVKDLALIGGFGYKIGSMFKPKFTSQEELRDSRYKTRFVSQNYFNIKMDLLFSRWNKPANKIYILWKKIVMDMKIHGRMQNDEDSYKEDSIIE